MKREQDFICASATVQESAIMARPGFIIRHVHKKNWRCRGLSWGDRDGTCYLPIAEIVWLTEAYIIGTLPGRPLFDGRRFAGRSVECPSTVILTACNHCLVAARLGCARCRASAADGHRSGGPTLLRCGYGRGS